MPKPEFLYETVPFFAEDDIAFVQTPQAYGNLDNVISQGAGYMQSVFYRFIQPGKNRFNAAFCVGTNVIYRRAAIDSIGGIYSESKSEDVWTSLMLHEKGWRTVYIPTELAIGDTPETVEAYTKQQLRWATGGFEIMFTHNPLLPQAQPHHGPAAAVPRYRDLLPEGVAPGLLLLVPPLQIYFGLTPMNSGSAGTWLMYYLGFYFMQIVVALYTIGSFRWETLMLATASFPIYRRALVNAIFNKDQKWHVTGSMKKKASPFNFITHQLMAFVFLAITSVVGIWQALTVSAFTLALFWNLLNTFILGLFVVTAMREARGNRREAKGLPQAGAKRAAKKALKAAPKAGSGLAERTYDALQPVGTR